MDVQLCRARTHTQHARRDRHGQMFFVCWMNREALASMKLFCCRRSTSQVKVLSTLNSVRYEVVLCINAYPCISIAFAYNCATLLEQYVDRCCDLNIAAFVMHKHSTAFTYGGRLSFHASLYLYRRYVVKCSP